MKTLCDSSFKVQLIIKTLCDLPNKDFIERISAFQTKIRLQTVQLLLLFIERQNTLSAFLPENINIRYFATFHSMKNVPHAGDIYQQAGGINYNWRTLSII